MLLLPILLVAAWAASVRPVTADDSGTAVPVPVVQSASLHQGVTSDYPAPTNRTRLPTSSDANQPLPQSIQRITATATAEDLGGYFIVHYMGDS